MPDDRPVRIYFCTRCFNLGGTLVNAGTKNQKLYVHQGRCPPFNYLMANHVMAKNHPDLYWLPWLNLGFEVSRDYGG